MSNRFDLEWAMVEAQVKRYCRRIAGDADIAADIVQEVHLRAWRGYLGFSGRASFLTWVISIARREALHQLGKARMFVPIDDMPEQCVAPSEELYYVGSMPAHLAAAVRNGALSAEKAAVLQARLADGNPSWDTIGAELGLSANHCAVLHARAVADLRVYLFLQRHPMFGGHASVAEAYKAAGRVAEPGRLTNVEADVFRRCVLDQPPKPPTSRDAGILRAAAAKVAFCLPAVAATPEDNMP